MDVDPRSTSLSAVGRVISTAVLMALAALALHAPVHRMGRELGPLMFYLVPVLPSIIATAVAGAVAMRILGARWPEPVVASILWVLLATLVLLIVRPDGSTFQVDWFAVLLPFHAGGVLLLSLFDPVVRRQGAAPTAWKVAVTAVALTALLLGTAGTFALYQRAATGPTVHWDFAGLVLVAFVLGGPLALLLVGLGLVLSVFRTRAWGAWIGCLGSILGICVVLGWRLAGSPWFP